MIRCFARSGVGDKCVSFKPPTNTTNDPIPGTLKCRLPKDCSNGAMKRLRPRGIEPLAATRMSPTVVGKLRSKRGAIGNMPRLVQHSRRLAYLPPRHDPALVCDDNSNPRSRLFPFLTVRSVLSKSSAILGYGGAFLIAVVQNDTDGGAAV